MSIFSSPRFLRTVLWADCASCTATAGLQLMAPAQLAQVLGLPAALLLESGFALVGVMAFVAWIASRAETPRSLAWVLVAGNFAWAAGCLVLATRGVATSGLGLAYLVVQALAVGVLAELEWIGLRRQPVAGWA